MRTPERDLWASVVQQAISEATEQEPKKEQSPGKNHKHRSQNAALRTAARKWLLGNSDDFRAVCEYAGMNPDAVRERMEKLLKKARAA
ncbi:MAG TPA: hypothetical protein PKO05_02760 [Thermoanaerobaculia bacterium]|nr:hypothetical protein [Thermoanaerobaculia bacterium]